MSRIVQVANFVTPRSGGLRTALGQLAEGYAAHGHEVVQVLPGPADGEQRRLWGRVITLAAPVLPATGYRLIARPGRVTALLDDLAPDRLEVHDRTTLRGLGRWAASRGVPSMVISHERLDRLLGQWLPGGLPLAAIADRSNSRLAGSYDTVVCTTEWAAEEFTRLGTRNLVRVALGVDLAQFHPGLACPALREEFAPDGAALLVMATRLSREKRPDLALAAVADLVRRRRRVRLVIAGDGPLRAQLRRQGAALPVQFTGFLSSRIRLAQLMATADVVLAPGPVETFGLAALEALASGTPVVANPESALPEVLGPASASACHATGRCFAGAVAALLDRPGDERRRAARERAECYPWSATVSGFLAAHRLSGAQACA